MSYFTDEQTISIPITANFRETAWKFAHEQPTQEQGKQVYLNTLAVLVVNNYLQILDIPTQLKASHSWHPCGRLVADVADLLLTGVGRLECRPMRTGDRFCYIPPEVWDNRIGYVVVELDKTCQEGKIRGFLPTATTSEIDIEQLQPLEALIEHSHLVQLRQWLEGIYSNQWQSIEDLFHQRNPQLTFRSKRIRGFELDTPEKVWQLFNQLYPHHSWKKNLPLELEKNLSTIGMTNLTTSYDTNKSSEFSDVLVHLLRTTPDEEIRWTLAEILWTLEPKHPAISARRIMDLGMQLAGNSVALMVAILPKPNRNVAVLLRVYPMGNQSYLPPGLELAGLYEHGEPFLVVQARENKDDYIQLKFCAEFGERFQVRVRMNNISITENFII